MPQPSDRYIEVARVFRDVVLAADGNATFAPATPDELTAAQDALGCRFPDSYAWFQLEFGHVPNGPFDIYSVRHADAPALNIVGINLDERSDAHPALPTHLIAFSDSGGGDLLCFDTSALKNGECPVVWWDHEADQDQEPARAASSFLDWVEQELQERAVEEKGSLLDTLGHVHQAWMREWFKKK